jgi:multiple sugar transport system substrate-binding protein
MKKIIALVLVFVVLGLMLIGCGSSEKASQDEVKKPDSSQQSETGQTSEGKDADEKQTDTDKPVTLKFILWDLKNTTYIPPMLDAYKKLKPNVTFDIIDIPANEYNDKLSVMLAGGDESDIISVKDIPGYASMINKNQILALNEYIEKDNFDLKQYSGITNDLTVDGKIYALPYRSDFWVLYYNKRLFDKANVPYPSNDMTWEEYEQLARKLTSGSGADKVYGSMHHTWRSTVQLATVQDGKHSIITEDYSFMKPMYEMILRMQKDGIIPDYASLKAGNIHYSSMFFNEQIAMLPMGTWFIGTLISKIKAGEVDVEWGIAKFPHPEGVEPGTTAGTLASLAINSKAPNKDAAWDFLKFFCGPEGAKILAEVGSLPAIRNEEVINILANMDGFPKECAEALKTAVVRLEMPMHEKVTIIDQILNEEHELIMTESVSIDEGLANMSRRVKEALAQ